MSRPSRWWRTSVARATRSTRGTYWGTDDEAVERFLMRGAVERVVEHPGLPPAA
ncbi:MAG: hypothetical protein QOH72_2454 [Solirubrobacteraceae bacterium]|jgi:hypothetical protein|nr:hypothetical protein [Solirubrobacteraceae bacterium]